MKRYLLPMIVFGIVAVSFFLFGAAFARHALGTRISDI